MNSVSTGSETRTQTPVKATDFESVVSTISPTRQVLKLYQKMNLQCNRKNGKIIKNLVEYRKCKNGATKNKEHTYLPHGCGENAKRENSVCL